TAAPSRSPSASGGRELSAVGCARRLARCLPSLRAGSDLAQPAQDGVHDRVCGDRLLASLLHVAQHGLCILDDRDIAGPERPGVPELALERAPGELHLGGEPGGALGARYVAIVEDAETVLRDMQQGGQE